MKRASRRPAKIYRDLLKERHTSHWDLDYLSREELNRIHDDGRRQARDYKIRQFLIIALIFLLLCLFPTLVASLRGLVG